MKEVYMNHDLESNFTHDFNIRKYEENGDDVTALFRTSNSQWTKTAKGKLAGRISDSGDGLLVELFDTDGSMRERLTLDYDVAEELFILLSQQEFAPFEIRESKTTMKWPLSQ
jgi:hypothetical protein